MRRVVVLCWSGLAVLLVAAMSIGQSASARDPLPATVAGLQTRVASLETTVARQATQISDLQTSVASSPNLAATPIATPEPRSLDIQIVFRADPANIESDGLGEPCFGTGRFADFGEDPDIGIYDSEEDLLVSAVVTGSELTHEGTIFSECTMTLLLEEIPYQPIYIVGITNRSVMTYDYAELEAMDWSLMLSYG
jgi:hypothetical protein